MKLTPTTNRLTPGHSQWDMGHRPLFFIHILSVYTASGNLVNQRTLVNISISRVLPLPLGA